MFNGPLAVIITRQPTHDDEPHAGAISTAFQYGILPMRISPPTTRMPRPYATRPPLRAVETIGLTTAKASAMKNSNSRKAPPPP